MLAKRKIRAALFHVPKTTAIVKIGGTDNSKRRGDVVFVHGLMGDARGTWEGEAGSNLYWPQMLADMTPDIGVWALDYDAWPSDWLGATMPIESRSKNLLEQMRLNGLGKKPIIFVTHSLGGLVVKQVLRDAATLQNPDWKPFAENTKGVSFLATPHTGSLDADLLNLISLKLMQLYGEDLELTVSVDELTRNSATLRDLNIWYRQNVRPLKINTQVLYESLPCGEIGIIVDQSSSDPGITDVIPTPVVASHLTICKPSQGDKVVFQSVADFIEKHLKPAPIPWPIAYSEFIKEYNEARYDAAQLATFKALHKNQQVTWEAVIIAIVPDEKKPAYSIGLSTATRIEDRVFASFPPEEFELGIAKGTKVRMTGVVHESTSSNSAVLHDCKLVEKFAPPPE